VVQKKECVLHVKKRMFRRVKEAKKAHTQYLKAKKQLEEAEKKRLKKNQKAEDEKNEVAPKKRRSKSKPRGQSSTSSKDKKKTLALTNGMMVKLSTYYGLAILRNSDSVEEMKKSIWATFYHLISTDENPQHLNCSILWCKYQ